MRVKPVRPASGYAIRSAFQIAASAIAVRDEYKASHEERGGEMHFKLFECTMAPVESHAKGDSMLIENGLGERICLTLMPVWSETSYEEFEIRAESVDIEFESYKLCRFHAQLVQLMSLIDKRLAMWGKDSVNDAA